MPPVIKQSGNMQPTIDFEEHASVNGEAAKKVVLLDPATGDVADARHMYAYDVATTTWRPVQLVESTSSAGFYVLAVGNYDGSPISGGAAAVDYSDLLIQDGSFYLLQNGDNLLLQA